VVPQDDEPSVNSQSWLIEHRGVWHSEE